MYNKIIIGIDQSYTRCGISVAGDGKLLKVSSTSFRSCLNKTEKRKMLSSIISKLIEQGLTKAPKVDIIVERIRTISQGKNQKQGFGLKPDYLKSTGALIAVIVDVAYDYGVEVYSVDTRSWKAKVIGTSKGVNGDNKMPTILFVKSLGFDVSYLSPRGLCKYDDDSADSACIALYGFLPKHLQNLKKEE